MEQLKEIYERYIETAETVWEERPIWDGAFGIGASTKDHPCHLEFYKNVERWVENFLKNAPDRETAEQAIAYVLQTSQAQKGAGDPASDQPSGGGWYADLLRTAGHAGGRHC